MKKTLMTLLFVYTTVSLGSVEASDFNPDGVRLFALIIALGLGLAGFVVSIVMRSRGGRTLFSFILLLTNVFAMSLLGPLSFILVIFLIATIAVTEVLVPSQKIS